MKGADDLIKCIEDTDFPIGAPNNNPQQIPYIPERVIYDPMPSRTNDCGKRHKSCTKKIMTKCSVFRKLGHNRNHFHVSSHNR